MLAARGSRNLDGGEERVNDSDVATGLRRKAKRIHVKAVLTAALLTLLGFYF